MTVNEAFEIYRSNLEITESEQEFAKKKNDEIRQVMREEFDLKEDFLTGSYKRHTKTKPLKDVDIFCVLNTTDKNINDFRKKEPDVILRKVEGVLKKKYSKVSKGWRSVEIEFGPSEKVVSFDIVPAFERKGRGYEIPDSPSKTWIGTDPTVHADKATEKNDELDGKWKPLVKMIKGWNRTQGKVIRPSFLIEVMALEIVDSAFTDYPWELQSLFLNAANGIMKSWPDPAGLGPNVDSAMSGSDKLKASEALKNAGVMAEKARRLDNKGNTYEALKVWRELFGPYFPLKQME